MPGGPGTFSPDGRYVATYLDEAQNEKIRIWNVTSGQLHKTLTRAQRSFGRSTKAIRFSSDSKYVLTIHEGSTQLWDVEAEQHIQAFSNSIDAAAGFSPDGKMLIVGEDTFTLYDLETRRFLPVLDQSGPVISISISNDSKRLATGTNDGIVGIWDLSTGRRLHKLQHQDERVDDVSFSPDGRLVMSSSRLGRRMWESDSGHLLWQTAEHCDRDTPYRAYARFASNGAIVLTVGSTSVRVFDSTNGKLIANIPIIRPISMDVSLDGQRIATAGYNGAGNNSPQFLRVWNGTGGLIGTFEVPGFHVNALKFSPDGTRIGIVTSDAVRIWSLFPFLERAVDFAKKQIDSCIPPDQRETYFVSRSPPRWCIEGAKPPYNTPEWKRWLQRIGGDRITSYLHRFLGLLGGTDTAKTPRLRLAQSSVLNPRLCQRSAASVASMLGV